MINTFMTSFAIALSFIVVYTTYDIGSFFLSMMALWEIIVTVPLTWFIYRVVFNIPQLGGLNFSIIFILFAVGVYYYPAYVFVDHWLQSKHQVKDQTPKSWKKRMAVAWQESARAAGVAQTTTFIPFFAGAGGSVMWFRSFGVFAGLAILVNYLLGITLYPCSIIIWETYLRPTEQKFVKFMKHIGLGMISFEMADAYHGRYFKQKTKGNEALVSDPTVKFIDVGYGPQTYEELGEFSYFPSSS